MKSEFLEYHVIIIYFQAVCSVLGVGWWVVAKCQHWLELFSEESCLFFSFSFLLSDNDMREETPKFSWHLDLTWNQGVRPPGVTPTSTFTVLLCLKVEKLAFCDRGFDGCLTLTSVTSTATLVVVVGNFEICWVVVLHKSTFWSSVNFLPLTVTDVYTCVMELWWSKDSDPGIGVSQKWRPQQAYGSNQVLLAQPQTIFSTSKILTLTHR